MLSFDVCAAIGRVEGGLGYVLYTYSMEWHLVVEVDVEVEALWLVVVVEAEVLWLVYLVLED